MTDSIDARFERLMEKMDTIFGQTAMSGRADKQPTTSEILAADKARSEEFDKKFERWLSGFDDKLRRLQASNPHPVKEAIDDHTPSEPSQVHELGSVTNNTTSFVEDCTKDAGEKSSPEHHRLVSVSTESDLIFEKKMKSVPTVDVDSDLDTCSDLVMAKLTDVVEEEVIFSHLINNFSSELVLNETEVVEGKETHGFANQICVPNGSISICSQGVCQNASMGCSSYFIMCASTDSYILVPAVKVDNLSVLLRNMDDSYKVESSLLCRLPPWRGIKGVRRCRYVKIIDGNYVYDKGKSDMYDIEWYGAVVEENKKVKRDGDVAELENGVDSLFESVARFHSHMLSVGQIAGLEVIRSIDEHTVIFMEYEFEKKNSGTILVFDPGGGTLNVSVHEGFVKKLNSRDLNANVDVGAIAQNFCGLSELGCYALIEDMFYMSFSTAKDDIKWILRGHIQHGSENHNSTSDKVTKAVNLAPTYFMNSQRMATEKAGEFAEFKGRKLDNEPDAVLLAYELETKKIETSLVFDPGGYTSGALVFELAYGVSEALSITEDKHLVCYEFDNRVFDWFPKDFRRGEGINFINYKHTHQLIRKAKRKVLKMAFPVVMTSATDLKASLIRTRLVECLGPVQFAIVGISIIIFEQASRILVYPLFSIMSICFAEDDTCLEKHSVAVNTSEKLEKALDGDGCTRDLMPVGVVFYNLEMKTYHNTDVKLQQILFSCAVLSHLRYLVDMMEHGLDAHLCAVLSHLRYLVDMMEHGLDAHQKVQTIVALPIVALKRASAVYGNEGFDSFMKLMGTGVRYHRGAAFAAFLEVFGFIIPQVASLDESFAAEFQVSRDSDLSDYMFSNKTMEINLENSIMNEQRKKDLVLQLNSYFGLEDYVSLVRYINNFFVFSLPRPPEVANLEDKVNFMGRGMLRNAILGNLREAFAINVIRVVYERLHQ